MTWLKDLNEFFKERLSNPFFFTFLFLWLVWNWQGIAYFVYSNQEVSYRLKHINENYIDIWTNLLNPLGVAIIVIIVSNGFFLLVEYFPDKLILKRKERLYERLAKQFKEKEKVAEAEFKYNLLKTKAIKVDQLNSEIEDLRRNIDIKDAEIERIRTFSTNLQEENNTNKTKISQLTTANTSVQNQLMNEKLINDNVRDLIKEWIDLINVNDYQLQEKTNYIDNLISLDLIKVLFKNNQVMGERTKNLKEFLDKYDDNIKNEQDYILILIIDKYLESMKKIKG
ncbi:hypothetical protein MM236_01075 [Belliella sp. DSM 107340]|uniref:Uncharacterized protein n=1 Tax=Belliella calami TaxID=2923436 RepID=A0ABS9UJ58_9BACT|nr:hypothetical protein [Belliella calami]MCH7396553.1 hypothetical protein [Belliella calami]